MSVSRRRVKQGLDLAVATPEVGFPSIAQSNAAFLTALGSHRGAKETAHFSDNQVGSCRAVLERTYPGDLGTLR